MLMPSDVVPELRRDLKMTRTPSGEIDILDPLTGTTFRFNRYEISLARMLNGRRPASEILQAGERLGVPVNLESLHKFILTLEEKRLVAPPLADGSNSPDVASAWAARGQWETSVRMLFQSGIRLLRLGRHAEAASYFEVLLQDEPENIEAKELLELARNPPTTTSGAQTMPAARHSGPNQPDSGFVESTQIGVTPAPAAGASRPRIGPSVSPPLSAPTLAHSSQPHLPRAAAQASQPPPLMHGAAILSYQQGSHVNTRERAPLRTVMIATGAVLGIVVGVIAWKLVWSTPQVAAATQPIAPAAAPTAPSTVAAALPTAPPSVAAAARPAAPQAVPLKPMAAVPKPEATQAEASSAEAHTAAATEAMQPAADDDRKTETETETEPAAAQDGSAAGVAKPDQAKADAKQGDHAADAAKTAKRPLHVDASSDGQVTAFLTHPRTVHKGDKLFQIVRVTDPAKAKELDAKIAELKELSKQDAMYEPFLANARQELDGVRKVVKIRAPRAGTARPHVRSGATVHAGQLLADIE
jgi:hypothetical protein